MKMYLSICSSASRNPNALVFTVLILCLIAQAGAVRLVRQTDNAILELSNAPYKRPSPPSQPSNATSGLPVRRIPGLDYNDIEKRQSCDDPNFPTINGCTGATCCPYNAPRCCTNSGRCIDEARKQCCPAGQQCSLYGSCCDTRCCENGSCCGEGYADVGCCDYGENCYRYASGPYIGRHTCLSPAEAASIFDTISSTTSYYTVTYASNLPGSDTDEAPPKEFTTSSAFTYAVGGGGAATSASPAELSTPYTTPSSSGAVIEASPIFTSSAGFVTSDFPDVGGISTGTAGSVDPTAFIASGVPGGSGSTNTGSSVESGMIGMAWLAAMVGSSVAAFML